VLFPRSYSRTREFFTLTEKEEVMFKTGTVAELESLELKGKIPEEVYQKVLRVVSYLDDTFGEDRDVEYDDGGFVCIAVNKEDLDYFAQNCVDLDSPALEYVELVPSDKEVYLNVFFLVNEHEVGITLFVPMSIAPERFLKEGKTSIGT
jgi:hypothetical protein